VTVQHATAGQGAKRLDVTDCQLMRIEGGKITDVRGHYSDQYAFDDSGPELLHDAVGLHGRGRFGTLAPARLSRGEASMNRQPGGALRRAVLLAAAVLGLVSVPGALGQTLAPAAQSAAPGNGGLPHIVVLSNRADLVSGGDALVQVALPARVDPSTVRVSLNGSDVTSAFAVRPDGRYEGVVTGLAVGANDLMATMRLGPTVHLTITNHPSGGPIFAGPQVQPWICRTITGFGAPADAQCNTASSFSYQYMDAGTHTFKAYDPAAPPAPASIANTTTGQGRTVPYIVRLEKGAMDRGLYDVAVLANPSAGWAPWASQPGWNHKVLYQFGGGTAPWHTNGAPQNDLIDMALSRGFLVANNNLNIRGDNANDVVSAEALTMLKEHIAEAYGPIRYTIGTGCSGGSIQQHQIAANYPGLLDGIQPNCSYQDSWTTANEVNDCHLLRHYFNTVAPGTFSATEQTAVEYTQDTSPCLFWDLSFAPVGIPSRVQNCNYQPGTPEAAQVYPNGHVRCDLQDYQSAIWGFRPQDGFARSPFANVGIQYGLSALQAGTITPEKFVALNEGVGGTDIDLNFIAARSQPDLVAQSIAYRTGQVTNATQLANVPIIDLRGSHNFSDIHTDYHSYVMRARLDAANGGHANQLIWTWNAAFFSIVPPPAIAFKSFLLMDSWLSNIESDTQNVPLSQKVLDDKPVGATDECFVGPTFIETTDAATCATTFPHYGDARLAAGETLVDNAMQCRLKALDPADYTVTFTAAQWTRLQQTFPDGVCDWSQAPVGFQPSIPWLSFAAGPGGQPLGPAPESHPGPPKQ
jgi:hypothetical protein